MVNCSYCDKEILNEKSLVFNNHIYCNLVCANVCKCVKCGKIDKLETFEDLFHCSVNCKKGIEKESYITDISEVESNLKKETLTKINISSTKSEIVKEVKEVKEVKDFKEEDYLNWVYVGNKYLKEHDLPRLRNLIERIKSIDTAIYKKYNIKLDLNRLIFTNESPDFLVYGGLMRGVVLNKKSGKVKVIFDLTSNSGSLKNLLNLINSNSSTKNQMIYFLLLYIIDLRRSPSKINEFIDG